jgi:hypothetical protein
MNDPHSHAPAPTGRFEAIFPLVSTEAKGLASSIAAKLRDIAAVGSPCTSAAVVEKARDAAERLPAMLEAFRAALPD